MASWQAHVVSWLVRFTIKRRLKNETDLARVRAVLGGGKLPAPKGVDFSPGDVGGIPGEWARDPATKPGAPTLLYLHGGGYFACTPQTHRPVTGWFARAGFDVFTPDYRLAPEHPFPAAIEDAQAAYTGLLAEGVQPARLTVAGDSAGGGLTMGLLLKLRDEHVPLPAAAALFSPLTDFTLASPSMRENARRDAMFWPEGFPVSAGLYLGAASPETPYASPLFGDQAGLPPLLIHTGETELLRDDSTRLAAKAQAAGVRVELKLWPVVPHVWQLLHSFIPEGRASLAEATAFLRGATGG